MTAPPEDRLPQRVPGPEADTAGARPAPKSAWRWSAAFRAVSGFNPDDVVAGRFRILRFIASGGMGEVYAAEDTELRERVALKIVRPEMAEDEEVIERFRREVQLARKVTHPSVCRSFDVFRHRFPLPPGWDGPAPEVTLLSMELLEGQTLSQRIKSGPLTTEEALPIVQQIASALGAAHDAGIVHRDLKSGNVMLVESPKGIRAVVTDFGLARAGGTTSRGRSPALTATGAIAGTPAYMAPEQVEGGDITPATDVYALGVVMFEMVTGKLPFEADSPLSLAIRRLNEKAPSPRTHVPGLDAKWEAAILRCLEREPADRFAGPHDLLKALAGEEVTPGPSLKRRARRRRVLVVAALVALLLGANVALLRLFRSRGAPAGPSRPSVAVLGFKNLSGRPEAAWLTKALSEMLTVELASGEKLLVVPGENVARMKIELSLPDAESLAPDTLGRIRNNLGTDLVVLGTYFAEGKDAGGKLRVDLRVQDATGGTVALVSDTGSEAEFLDLVSRTGSQLRRKLGGGGPAAADEAKARAALPSTPEAARLYAEGLGRLRLFDALAARDLLEKAIAADPGSPLAHSALAEAWSALGYDAKAKEEAKRAFDSSASLAREERLLVEGRYRAAARERDKAVEIYRTLFSSFPDSVEHGLRLAEAQTAAGKGKDALATVEILRKLPRPASEDPRIDLAEAQAAEALSEFKRCQASAARAAEKGRAVGARLLVAQGRFQEGRAFWRLGEHKKATDAAEETKRIFAEVGDRAGVARSLNLVANVLSQQGELAQAKATYEESLAIGRAIGDKGRAGAALNNIAIVLHSQGDLAGAKRMYEEALAIDRETVDKSGGAIDLNNIAIVLKNQGDLAGAKRMLGESLAIAREIGSKTLVAECLNNIAEVLRRQGDLAGAKRTYEESLGVSREIGDKEKSDFAFHGLGDLMTARGDLAAARKHYEEALALRTELGAKGGAAVTRVALAVLSIEEGRPDEAEVPAKEAAEELAKEKRADDEASAHAALARARLEQGGPHLHDAQEALERALALAAKSQTLEVRLSVALIAARVRAALGEPAPALERVRAALLEAQKSGFVALELEARLALGEIETASGNSAAGRAHLEALAQEAEAKGFGLIARKARRAPP